MNLIFGMPMAHIESWVLAALVEVKGHVLGTWFDKNFQCDFNVSKYAVSHFPSI